MGKWKDTDGERNETGWKSNILNVAWVLINFAYSYDWTLISYANVWNGIIGREWKIEVGEEGQRKYERDRDRKRDRERERVDVGFINLRYDFFLTPREIKSLSEMKTSVRMSWADVEQPKHWGQWHGVEAIKTNGSWFESSKISVHSKMALCSKVHKAKWAF